MEVEAVPYSKYGVTRGSMEVGMEKRPTLMVVAKGWPSWAVVADSSGLKLEVVVLLEMTWWEWVKTHSPGVVVIMYDEFVADKGNQYQADVVVSDIDLPGACRLWERVRKIYIGRRSVRHFNSIPSSFSFQKLKIDHVKGGGASNGTWGLFLYVKSGFIWSIDWLPRVAYRDLSGIINSTAGHGLSCPAPLKIASKQPRMVELRPKVYHGAGLFPFKERSAHYIVPSVFTNTRWCRRRLTAEETLLSLDIGESIIAGLKSHQKATLCNDTWFIPSKTTLQILQGASRMLMGVAGRSVLDEVSARPEVSLGGCTGVNPAISHPVDTEPSRALTQSTADRQERTRKATKADDAEVPVYLWNDRIIKNASELQAKALDSFRKFCFRWWRKNICREFMGWYEKKHGRPPAMDSGMTDEAKKDLDAGRDCLTRCMNSTFWEWSAGSRPHFWRWPIDYQKQIRDGIPIWIKGEITQWRRPQNEEKDLRLFEGMRMKIQNVRDKGYVKAGFVFSLTSFFAVPKGETDIRMVYHGTKRGFNGSCWAPWFMLPTVEQHLRATDPGSYMGDLDIGEMFLNFVLNEEVRQYCGIDLTRVFPEEVQPGEVLWETWARCGMGFTFSPYQAVQGVLWAEEEILGPGDYEGNPFNFDQVILNLPGSDEYEPWRPWVYKVTSEGNTASELLVYVDDVRVINGGEESCWKASHWVASKLNFLGLQDAARKRREPLLEPGAWAGSNVHTSDGLVCVLITQERWEKMKMIIQWISDQLSESQDRSIEHKTLERYRGVLVYISRTYPALVPYLKGIHLTLDSWRPWRKNDGWKMTTKEMRAYQIEHGWEEAHSGVIGKPPKQVKPAARLSSDIKALHHLTRSDHPPKRKTRPSSSVVALYGFADASGKGFGSTLYIKGHLHFRHGQWADHYDEESSNFRELDNLITAIEEAYREGLLDDAELFMFTDNSTAESAFYKGTSTSERLFGLVLRLRALQMTGDFVLHVIHCAGTRMKAQGTDGLSRADLTEGVMRGSSILSFVPLHLNAIERNPKIKPWVESWFGAEGITWLTPRQWFSDGQKQDRCIWFPPPAAADVAVELLAKAKHKRPQLEHVVLIPRLLTSKWRKLLSKVCDVVVTIPVGTDIWDYSLFEPLVVAITFPLIKHRPWRLKGTNPMERVERVLRDLPKTSPEWGGFVLRELCTQSRGVDKLPEGLVWTMLRGDRSD